MFTDKDLRELKEFSATDPVLSIYLNTDPTEGNADAYRLRLRNMLREINLADDLLAVERYFSTEYDWSGRGVVIFSCAPQSFFRAYPLAIPVRNLIHVGNRPNLHPLETMLDCYGGYGVVLVDKQGARLFSFHLGELHEQEGVVGEEVRRSKTGTASSMQAARSGGGTSLHKSEGVIDRNMKETVAFAVNFLESHHIRRVLIGGTDENVNYFRSLLPKAWQTLVMNTFPMNMNASHAEVLEKVLEMGVQADGHRQKHLVKELIDGAGGTNRAVMGIEPTLQAVNDGRVTTLVMTEGFNHPAYQCVQCGRMTILPHQTCSMCGGAYHELPNLIDPAVSMVMRAGGNVEIVRPDPTASMTDNFGAFLRY